MTKTCCISFQMGNGVGWSVGVQLVSTKCCRPKE